MTTALTAKQDARRYFEERIKPGESGSVPLVVSASYTGSDIHIPTFVWRAKEPGPWVSVTAAVHGDEINGTGAIRSLIVDEPFTLDRGTLILVPVVNIMGFERHSRYLPDRRDLNRSFPGSAEGSVAARLARMVFDKIVRAADYGIDLHTAAVRRTNFPNVRADMKHEQTAALARAFGAELIVHGRGPDGSYRRAACDAGCPTIILEAGEVWKVEPAVVEYAVRGIRNCLASLKMTNDRIIEPPFRMEADSTHWVRAEVGGFLDFHVGPGQIVEANEPLATNTSLTGERQNVIESPKSGIVLGMTTLPSVSPGDPVCHIAYAKSGTLRKIERAIDKLSDDHLHERTRDGLARSIYVREHDEHDEPVDPSAPDDSGI